MTRHCAPARIGFVATRAFPDAGGIESHVDNLLARIDPAKWDVDLVVTDPTGTRPSPDVQHGVQIRRHRAYPRSNDWHFSPGLFLDVLRGRRDLVHVHGVNTFAPPLGMLAALLSRTPLVVTFHSGGTNTEFRRRVRATQWRVLAPLLRRASALIAVSVSESETFSAVVGSGPIPVIPNGALEMVVPGDVEVDPDLVLAVGRLEQYKGHQHLIKALPYLMKTRPAARLRILGTGPYEAELRQLVSDLDLDDRVVFTSIPPEERAEMGTEMARAATVALLSDYEAHPVVVMEAAQLGRPVVARRNSGFVELIERGIVDPVPNDAEPALIADALDRAMSSGDRTVPDLPTWDECYRQVERTYERVLGLAPAVDGGLA